MQPFLAMSKVYASGGEPCCAECVTPVFDETWSPRSSSGATLPSKSGTQLSTTAGRNEPLLNSVSGLHCHMMLQVFALCICSYLQTSITDIHVKEHLLV